MQRNRMIQGKQTGRAKTVGRSAQRKRDSALPQEITARDVLASRSWAVVGRPYSWNIAALSVVAFFCVQALLAIPYLSATTDEPVHLSAGYSYWQTRDFRLNREHPPLAKLVAALPLLV